MRLRPCGFARDSSADFVPALLALLLLCGCLSTDIVVADPTTGFVAGGERTIRLEFERVPLDVSRIKTPPQQVQEPTSAGVIQFSPGESQQMSRPLPVRMKLPFLAHNHTGEPWEIRSSMFSLRDLSETPCDCKQGAAPQFVVVTIPPESGASFEVLVELCAAEGADARWFRDRRYELKVSESQSPAGIESRVYLQRTLLLTHYTPTLQLLRFGGVFVGGLLILGLTI